MNGCYDALGWGKASEALQDFTGGVTETVQLKDPPPGEFNAIERALRRHTLMSCSIVVSGLQTHGSLTVQGPARYDMQRGLRETHIHATR